MKYFHKNIISGIFFSISILFNYSSLSQQIDIGRIEMMPNIPEPYELRNWKQVAHKYDSLVFNLDASGTYLPLSSIIENTINYPEHPSFAIQSYVGTNSPPGREAINLLPAVIGASLAGIDKSDQFGYNWPLMCEEFFNKRPEENVYLNGPVASSGHDWWYETMPNVFFYQLNYLYPGTGEYAYQFVTVADRWLEAVRVMGGDDTPWSEAYMNYRAFDLSSMEPLEEGVKEPEAAGAIAWILYMAYRETGDDKYRKGAEWCMEFLNSRETNPSYELQMPYGAYIAARMNAEMGSLYDIEKMLNWCFDIGPIRLWGAVVEAWGGVDMHGLIGEARTAYPGYVFNMNGFEQAGALVPLVKYDDRFARAIGKWVLNVASASRFYYSEYLPDDMEDNEDWTQAYDPHSVIAYEALREYEEGPYGTGDAMNAGWAETNLGLYGASHVGIFGGLIEKTDIEGILQLDLLATDFYHEESYPSWLFYNPHEEEKTFTAAFPEGEFDVYNAVSNQLLYTQISGPTQMTLQADIAMIAVLIPSGTEISYNLNKTLAGEIVIDYSSGMQVDNYPPRIKSVASTDTVFPTDHSIDLYCAAEDQDFDNLNYSWSLNGTSLGNEAHISVNTPSETGIYYYRCAVEDENGAQTSDSVKINIVEHINYPPEIDSLIASKRYLWLNETTILRCVASDPNQEPLTYEWQTDGGSLIQNDSTAIFTAPGVQGAYQISCSVSDTSGVTVSRTIKLLVKDSTEMQNGELIAGYYFDGNLQDHSGYGHHGTAVNIEYTEDTLGVEEHALALPFSSSKVTVTNTDALNFRNGLTLGGWIYVDQFFNHESYPVSHGNWTNRWKISLTENRLRFTLNGENGIIDLDSESTLETNTWYHFAAAYDGAFVQIYLNGKLNAFASFQGLINTSTYDLVFGQSLPEQTGYDFQGNLDDIKLYNYGMGANAITELYQEDLYAIPETNTGFAKISVYPNPSSENLFLKLLTKQAGLYEISLYTSTGKQIRFQKSYLTANQNLTIKLPVSGLNPGIYLLQIRSGRFLATKKIAVSN